MRINCQQLFLKIVLFKISLTGEKHQLIYLNIKHQNLSTTFFELRFFKSLNALVRPYRRALKYSIKITKSGQGFF